ncbi:CBS domain-containing protein [Catellatospora sp. NPDC049111]|uniref:CBS domain-containing protein n=1 Tax=Catellatospora sp. NPDC049111 TaxID=3155271 RepID=UPI00340A8FB7
MNEPTVRDVMTAEVMTVPLDTTYADIAQLLARHKISAVPVLDDLHRLAGVVSEGDSLRRIEYRPPAPAGRPGALRHHREPAPQDRPLTIRPARTTAGSSARTASAAHLRS